MSAAAVDTTVVTMDASAADDMVTKESFAETKKLADVAVSELAATRAQLEAYQSRDRSKLKAFQTDMTAYIEELSKDSDIESKPHFDAMIEWSRNASERPNLSSQMQLGTVIHAAASSLKRVRADASVGSATADQLAAATKENEALKNDNSFKERRIGELSTSLKEMQENSEKLQQQLEAAGALAEKFDFSKASSREEGVKVDTAGVTVVTENASKVSALPSQPLAMSPADALLSFVSSSGGIASGRFTPAATNHSLLGATQSPESALASMLM